MLHHGAVDEHVAADAPQASHPLSAWGGEFQPERVLWKNRGVDVLLVGYNRSPATIMSCVVLTALHRWPCVRLSKGVAVHRPIGSCVACLIRQGAHVAASWSARRSGGA